MTIGIICEYNPFHNGHLYHLEKIKEKYPSSTIVLVLSGNFTQRGEISIINKWDKTALALNYGVDLVVELPFIYATQGADIFAKGSINILKELKVDMLIFGSESNDIDTLYNLANAQINNKEYEKLVKDYLDKGENYPTAMSKALKSITGITIDKPNDLLGLSYIKEIIKQNASIKVETIKRTNDFHNKELTNSITSATSIREGLKNSIDITKFIPKETNKYINNNYNMNINNYFKYLKYKIISEEKNISKYQTVDEGIENRILKYINKSNTLDELIEFIKTKRYTYNKLSRMFTHILTSLTKEEAKNIKLEYIRLLGFNNKGKQYLNKIKKEINIPILTKYSSLLKLELKVISIYSLIIKEDLITQEYKNKPIIK